MGIWDFFRKKEGAKKPSRPPPPDEEIPEPRADAPKTAPARAESDDVARLASSGGPGGPSVDEALALFRHLRTTPDEGRAVDALVRRAALVPLAEPLAVAVASALVDRAEPAAAVRLLASATSSPAILLRADLLAERGELAPALALSERVLLRDFDHPGARERHARWRTALGVGAPGERNAWGGGAWRDASTTTMVARETDSPFLVLREVARGGAGAVYEAEDRELGRPVALKVYHQPERDRAQLTHEAKVAIALAGPAVVRVYDVDAAHGWLALEWASQGALRDHVRGGDIARILPIEPWALPLAEALARTHARGWVHNDVKPANVLLTELGTDPAGGLRVMLADFGTARRIGEPSPPGSMGYISPERMRGRASHPRDDVYGFGRILEDVLDAAADPRLAERWQAIVAACVGPDEDRPADARALVIRLKIE